MIHKRLIISAAIMVIFSNLSWGQRIKDDFVSAGDSLRTLLKERTTITSNLRIDKILRRGENLDFYFTQELSDFPWHEGDIAWFRATLQDLFPSKYSNCTIGTIRYGSRSIEYLETPALANDGLSQNYSRQCDIPDNPPFIREIGGQNFPRGLSGRYIALWQSHGRYYEPKYDRWQWQRATVHRTVEDMYTQSYVIPFLIPMLQNAGAYTMSPRETDTQRHEIVADNDRAFAGPRGAGVRLQGEYSESGMWMTAGVGFSDSKEYYSGVDNPFEMGTVRMADCVSQRESWGRAEAKWSADIPERGFYAVYISYKSLPNSSENAHYTVHHMGGVSEFLVNQNIGGGTWICLGRFEFSPESPAYVTLDNVLPEGMTDYRNTVVTADAVRFGGGMGKVARGQADIPSDEWKVSGMPAFAEGAVYNMQWSGVDTTVVSKWDFDDYTTDFASRGAWTGYMKSKGIPFDLSLAFHSDAGISPNDSTIGTLAIYTLLEEGSPLLPDGRDRITARHLADLVQQQVCDDIRRDFNPDWSRRQLWDKNYSESRTTTVPGMILELLSHQNFADMKYGLDPAFRFTVCRAVYKGIVKYLSNLYGVPYTIQPLPVNSMSVTLSGNKARVSWKATIDDKEPTATPTGYILYTRKDDGAFDTGRILENVRLEKGRLYTEIPVETGRIYSFRVVAFNDGGKSFPSETLSAGIASKDAKKVLVVNNFDRVAPPSWFDGPEYAGFDGRVDKGVGYITDISYIGENYEIRRSQPWTDDNNPGFGATHSTHAGMIIQGNSFDYTITHGQSIMKAGYSFESSSARAFTANVPDPGEIFALDLLCGKQITTAVGSNTAKPRHEIFTPEMQRALTSYTSRGGSLIVSGAYIATDVWDQIYPMPTDSLHRASSIKFVESVLGYTWLTNSGCYTGAFERVKNGRCQIPYAGEIQFWQDLNSEIYSVENPDGVLPASKNASTILRYTGNGVSAAVCAKMKGYKVISYGFPLETVKDKARRDELFRVSLKYIDN